MVCMRVALHENNGGKIENDEDHSDSYTQEAECWIRNPKGPSRTKNKTVMEKIMYCFAVAFKFYYAPPCLQCREPFFGEVKYL